MKISVINCPDKEFEPFTIRAVEFFSNLLFEDKKLIESLSIILMFFDKMEDMGEAIIDDFIRNKNPKKFIIKIDGTMGADRIFETIAHEMVHVKQYALGELNATLTKWKGNKVDSDSMYYYFRPWEIEAHGVEYGLVKKFIIEEKLWKVFKGISNPDKFKLEKKPILWKKRYKKI
jgi:hypothetical protein